MSRIAMLGPFGLHPNKTMRSRALSLARALVPLGHSVSIIMPPWQTPEEAGRRWEEDGVELIYVELKGGIPGIVRSMLKEVARLEADAVYGFKPKAYSGLAMWWLWQRQRMPGSKRPFLITDTDDWEGWGGWNDIADYSLVQKYFFAWQERWGMAHCDRLTVASKELERRALDMGIPADKLLYLINGPGIAVDTALTSEEKSRRRQTLGLEGHPTLLLYSRLFEFNTERLIKILFSLSQQLPQLKVLMVGAGLFADQAAAFREQLSEAGLLDRCVDAGWVEEEKLPNLLRLADAGLYLMDDTLLNRTKCPVKLADMVALGIPVVAEEVGQVSAYIVQDESGLLRPTGDIDGVVTDLVRLLSDPPTATIDPQQSIAHYRQAFAWQKQAQRLDQIIKSHDP